MEILDKLINVALIAATLRTTAPILLVALGGSFTTKAGIFNIGLEGQMLVGAFFAVLGRSGPVPHWRASPAALRRRSSSPWFLLSWW
nr:hypothetical protein [Mesorhizobium sp. M7A.F.Ca.US.002.01.1.1]